jgi:predicted nucleotidyltransferase component of viral defense system
MLDKKKHELIMGSVLQGIYSDVAIASLLGFKGGTCARFFYGLPRFSVDLDFDLLSGGAENQKTVFEAVLDIAKKRGQVKDSYMKRNTIFFLLSYGDGDHNIKIEINARMHTPRLEEHFELKEHLGISMLVARQPYVFASKLAALTSRKKTAMRDIYDIWYFAGSNWDIDVEVLKLRTGKSVKEHLADCIAAIEQIKDNQILQGLADLLSGEKEKAWARSSLRKETVLLLKNYMSVLS